MHTELLGMTIEQALITALTTVTSALCYLYRKLEKKVEAEQAACKADQKELREKVENMQLENAIRVGRIEAYQNCPRETCPFKVKHTGDTPAHPR